MTATNQWRLHFFVTLCLTFNMACLAQKPTDWPMYGHDSGSTRFSSLADINTGNVAELKRAWTYHMAPPQAPAAAPVTGIATVGGLVFISATNDHHFRAFESKTGKILWDTTLEAGAYATPSTYKAKDSKQYVAIVATSGRYYDKTGGDSVAAYALPWISRSRTSGLVALYKLRANPDHFSSTCEYES